MSIVVLGVYFMVYFPMCAAALDLEWEMFS